MHVTPLRSLLVDNAHFFIIPESHAVEKRQLVNEIVSLKKMSDLHERDCARRDLQVHQYKNEADKGLTALQEAERKVQNYRIEVC